MLCFAPMKIAIFLTNSAISPDHCVAALEKAGLQPQVVHPLSNDVFSTLDAFSGFVWVHHDTLAPAAFWRENAACWMPAIRAQNALGKPLLEIGAHTQGLLLESGVIPGLARDAVGISLAALSPPEARRAVCLSEEFQWNAFTRHLAPHDVLEWPSCEVSAQFVIPPALLRLMQGEGMDVLHWHRSIHSVSMPDAVAAVSNRAGNAMTLLMPAEHALTLDRLFTSLREYIHEGHVQTVTPLCYQGR